jgi:osmotically-inducible protein OsmY
MKSIALPRLLPVRSARPVCETVPPTATRPDADGHHDESIRSALLARLSRQPWWDAGRSNVFVDHGRVVYQGVASIAGSDRAARQLALDLPGVREVWDARVPRREWQSLG